MVWSKLKRKKVQNPFNSFYLESTPELGKLGNDSGRFFLLYPKLVPRFISKVSGMLMAFSKGTKIVRISVGGSNPSPDSSTLKIAMNMMEIMKVAIKSNLDRNVIVDWLNRVQTLIGFFHD